MKFTTAGAVATVVGTALACAIMIPLTDTIAGNTLDRGITGNADTAINGQVVYGSR